LYGHTDGYTRNRGDVEPSIIYAKLTDALLLPQWAPVFADRVEATGALNFRITKGSDSFAMELVKNDSAWTVDYLRPIQNGKKGGAFIRVVPRPLGGATIVMTVPVGRDATPDQVAALLEEELKALVKLSSSR
jgi:hypothetical protein